MPFFSLSLSPHPIYTQTHTSPLHLGELTLFRAQNMLARFKRYNLEAQMSERMIVIGTGPIGGIIGGRLARAGHNITFVDVDKEHVAAIRQNGLQVDVPDGSFNVKIKIVFP